MYGAKRFGSHDTPRYGEKGYDGKKNGTIGAVLGKICERNGAVRSDMVSRLQ